MQNRSSLFCLFMHLVNGGLSEWTTWTGCSQMCVQGRQTRCRLCNNPPPRCGGDPCGGMVAKEERQCLVCPSKLLLLALSYENHGQLTISFRTIYQYGRKTEDPKLPPCAPCILRSYPVFLFPPFILAWFPLISPACYHFRTSTSHSPNPSLPVFSLFTPLRQTSFGPLWGNCNMGWTRWLDKVDAKHFNSWLGHKWIFIPTDYNYFSKHAPTINFSQSPTGNLSFKVVTF